MPRVRKTPEEVSASRRAAINQRWHPAPEPDDLEADGNPLGDFLSPETSTNALGQTKQKLPGFCAYDEVVQLRVVTYQDAQSREKAIAEELANDIRRQDAAIRRRALFTSDQVEADALAYDEAVVTTLKELPELLASSMPLDQRDQARAVGKEWLAKTRATLAATMRGMAADKARKK